MFHINQQVRSNKFGEGYVSEISHREDGFVITCIFSAENAKGTIIYYNEIDIAKYCLNGGRSIDE